MSHTHIEQPKPTPKPFVWWHVAFILAIPAVILSAISLAANWAHSAPPDYDTAPGNILELRKVVDSTTDSMYGGRINVRIEAHVRYLLAGHEQDRWIRLSNDIPRETFLLKLAENPTHCLVFWPPKHPENAQCSLK